MSIEMRGLIAAVVAGVAVLGITFGLAAAIRAVRPSVPRTAQVSGAGLDPHAALVSSGQGFYKQSCARCHGPLGQGGSGPSLRHSNLTDSQVASTIKKGVPGAMPAFGNQYKDPDVQALVAFVRSLK